ncbi:hypothetical protein G6L63_10075 [Agrobacterium vitis]|uniref:Uncharacterized protein n=1 Tax=Agrobacterium vitis TaxID=373 RepID=A0A368NFR6_AGRVI|nr:hypothetical protein [Agrobacterium vitis]KAA3512735.1 hypothetical protein DXM22_15990 [Agrobacterium vitis]KAA3526152.1 hypothetical protein DXT89_16665 [Agrobacterium vitis]MCF1478110.1 hypothetical protein [Agrobacterium vitis]MUZ99334.1 hypothetical protein [Agrobacterium vitis]MVA32739.1 hypothetical protein [Agrobacterium vitis]
MTDASQLTAAGKIAMEYLKKYDPKVEDVNFFDEIHDFGGGTMVLAEVKYPAVGASKEKHASEYFILVRNGRGFVFQDYAMALREGSKPAEIISKIASPDVVTALLTFFLVGAFVFLTFTETEQTDQTKALSAALTTVLGFWFGRQTK